MTNPVVIPATTASTKATDRSLSRNPTIQLSPSASTDELTRIVNQLSRSVEMREGRSKDSGEAFVTINDLLDAGIVSRRVSPSGGGGGDITKPKDTSDWSTLPYVTVPPIPQNVKAASGIGMVYITWDMPKVRGIGACEIWRSPPVTYVGTPWPTLAPTDAPTDAPTTAPTDAPTPAPTTPPVPSVSDEVAQDVVGAVKIATVSGGGYVDTDMSYDPDDFEGIKHYYFVRFVSERGINGEFAAGVPGKPLADPKFVIAQLSGKIDKSMLVQSLRHDIELAGVLNTDVVALNTKYAGLTWNAINGTKRAGFGIINDGTVSEFAINADRFYILSATEGDINPFFVDAVTGKTYINHALINVAEIATAIVGNLTVTTAMISNATINTAQLTGDMQSSTYVGLGGPGWKLYQNGGAYFGTDVMLAGMAGFRSAESGERVEVNNKGLRMWDANGTLRVIIGVLADPAP